MFYNKALLGPECNFSTYPIQKLVELNYPNIFVRKKEDTYSSKHEKSFGFKTTSITRPLILGNLQEIVKDEIDKIVDIDTLDEIETIEKRYAVLLAVYIGKTRLIDNFVELS